MATTLDDQDELTGLDNLWDKVSIIRKGAMKRKSLLQWPSPTQTGHINYETKHWTNAKKTNTQTYNNKLIEHTAHKTYKKKQHIMKHNKRYDQHNPLKKKETKTKNTGEV